MPAINTRSKRNGQSTREVCRGDVAIAADIRVIGSSKNRVKVADMSLTGFRMECLTFISGTQTIFLSIPGFEQLESRVIWQTEWIYGCQFARPLHIAVYEHIARTFPALEPRKEITVNGFLYGADAVQQWKNLF